MLLGLFKKCLEGNTETSKSSAFFKDPTGVQAQFWEVKAVQ